MLDKVKWVEIWWKWNFKTLLPIHKKLILNFPRFRNVLIKRLLEIWKIWNTIKEVNRSVDEILAYDNQIDEVSQIVKYSWKVMNLVQEIARENNLFYEDLPKWWEEYLIWAVEECICSMKNKEFLLSIFHQVILDIKNWKKVNFSEIYKLYPEKLTYKYEIAKIVSLLKNKYNIEFIWIWWSGSVIKIWDFVEKNDVKNNINEIKKALKRLKDHNGETINIIIDSFSDFVENNIQKRHLNEFQQHEFITYCLWLNPQIDIWILRASIKKIFKNLLEQWIIVRKKSKINFEIKTNKAVNNYYNSLYFLPIWTTSQFSQTLDKLIKNTARKNKEFLEVLKNEMITLQNNSEFFVLSRFIEKKWYPKERIAYWNRILIKLIQSWMIWRKWRERYYIKNLQLKEKDTKTDLLETSYALEKYSITGDSNSFSQKILYYIFKDLKNSWCNHSDIKSEDLKIHIDGNEIFLLFQNSKFKSYENHLSMITDQIWEEKNVIIHVIFSK